MFSLQPCVSTSATIPFDQSRLSRTCVSFAATMPTEEQLKTQAMLKYSEKSSVEDVATTAQQIDPSTTEHQLASSNDITKDTSGEKGTAVPIESATATPEYPKAWKSFVIVTALCLAVFLVALDQTIVAVAVPKITDHFHSLDDVGWCVCHKPVFLDQSLMPTGMALHICLPEQRYNLSLDESMLNSMYANCAE